MGDNQGETQRCVYAVLEFLQEEFNKSTTTSDSKESIEVAMQCLETAFGVNLKDTQYKPKTSLRNSLQDAQRSGPTSSSSAPLSASRGQGQGQINMSGPPYQPPADATEEVQKSADLLKNMGNEKMKDGLFEEARAIYDRAIELDGKNAVYFCNRAAAFLKLDEPDKALRDCQIAIQLQPNYARAYGRMGVVYSNLSKHAEAAECYRKASQLDPVNESYLNNLKVAEEWAESGDSESNQQGATGAAAAAAAGVPNFQAMFSDPNLINMASQMLQNPNMLNMMRSFMSGFQNTSPSAPNDAAPPPANAPSMDGLLQMGQAIAQQIRQANPNLADQLNSQLGGNNNPGGPRSSPHGDSYDL